MAALHSFIIVLIVACSTRCLAVKKKKAGNSRHRPQPSQARQPQDNDVVQPQQDVVRPPDRGTAQAFAGGVASEPGRNSTASSSRNATCTAAATSWIVVGDAEDVDRACSTASGRKCSEDPTSSDCHPFDPDRPWDSADDGGFSSDGGMPNLYLGRGGGDDSDGGSTCASGPRGLRIGARDARGRVWPMGSPEFRRLFPNADMGDLAMAQSFFISGLFRHVEGPFNVGIHRDGGVVVRYDGVIAWCRPIRPPEGGWPADAALGDMYTMTDYGANAGQLVHHWEPEEIDTGYMPNHEQSESEDEDDSAPQATRPHEDEGHSERSPE